MEKEKAHIFGNTEILLDGIQFETNEVAIITKRRQIFFELIRLQNELNQQLIINAGLLNSYMSAQKSFNLKTGCSDASTNPSSNRNRIKQKNQKMPFNQKGSEIRERSQSIKKRRKKVEDSDYEPEQSQSNHATHSRLSETKNVPKNYGKAILTFIKKQKHYVERVLEHFCVSTQSFSNHLQKYKGKINTIAELRSLWISDHNPYAKPLRIISIEYLRKHSLSHIFNSRVENYAKHVKYRYKIASGLQNPYEFTQIKDF